MWILNSMTRATPETRLLLLILLVQEQKGEVEGESDIAVTGNDLGLSKKQIGTALGYLVEQSYLWKTKTVSKCQQTDKRKTKSIYGLTSEAIELWIQSANQTMWKDDVFFWLSNKQVSQFQKLVNNHGQTTDCLLVLIGLLSHANPAKYVCGCEIQVFSQMLGLSEIRIRRAISALAKSGMVSIAAQGVGDTIMFGQLAPIYRIHSVPINMKMISVGIFVQTTLIPFNFINELAEFYKKMKKNAARSRFRYSKQVSGLSDEVYYELAKMITGKRIEASLYHLCLSTIFSLVPWHAEVLSVLDSQEATEVSANRSDTELQNRIFNSLSLVLFRGPIALKELNQMNFQQDPISISDYMAHMRQFTLDSLTRELSIIIKGLSRQWKIFIEGQSLNHAKLVGYLPFGEMNLIPYKADDLVSAQLPTLLEQATDNPQNWRMPCVLMAQVLNNEKYDHCAVLDDELWVVNASVSGKRIRHIKRMICTNRETLIFDKSA